RVVGGEVGQLGGRLRRGGGPGGGGFPGRPRGGKGHDQPRGGRPGPGRAVAARLRRRRGPPVGGRGGGGCGVRVRCRVPRHGGGVPGVVVHRLRYRRRLGGQGPAGRPGGGGGRGGVR